MRYPCIMLVVLIAVFTVGCLEENQITVIVENNDASQARYARDLSEVEEAIQKLNPTIGAYPPRFTSDTHGQEVYEIWFETTRLTQELDVVFPNDSEVKVRLGELSQMGHNLDVKGSAQQAELALTSAIQLDQRNIRAYISLARLYINSGVKQEKAEQLLFEAKRLSSPNVLSEADLGLMYVYLQLERKEDAIQYGQYYLEANPTDIRIKKMVEAIRTDKVKNRWAPLQ